MNNNNLETCLNWNHANTKCTSNGEKPQEYILRKEVAQEIRAIQRNADDLDLFYNEVMEYIEELEKDG